MSYNSISPREYKELSLKARLAMRAGPSYQTFLMKKTEWFQSLEQTLLGTLSIVDYNASFEPIRRDPAALIIDSVDLMDVYRCILPKDFSMPLDLFDQAAHVMKKGFSLAKTLGFPKPFLAMHFYSNMFDQLAVDSVFYTGEIQEKNSLQEFSFKNEHLRSEIRLLRDAYFVHVNYRSNN